MKSAFKLEWQNTTLRMESGEVNEKEIYLERDGKAGRSRLRGGEKESPLKSPQTIIDILDSLAQIRCVKKNCRG